MQSHAQVIFSDPIVIRYGNGVDLKYAEGDDASHEEGQQDYGKCINGASSTQQQKIKKIPCPVLEFRIINRLFNEVGGEIIDAALNVVASIDSNEAGARINADLPETSEHTGIFKRRRSGLSVLSSKSSDDGSEGSGEDKGHPSKFAVFSRKQSSSQDDIDKGGMQQELRASNSESKSMFSKMVIEAGQHPLFKRVWLARHVLDETSPLLTPRTRKAIMKNGGYWPDHLNSYAGVRESIEFNQILVSLYGVSNVSAAEVYAQKIYNFVDVNVGYQFVNLLYRGEADQLQVDIDLINDVREQIGGGGEPLIMGD
jgi:hypothetical protein